MNKEVLFFMNVMLILMSVDILLGVVGGVINKELESKKGTKGLMKHSIIMILSYTIKVVTELMGFSDIYNIFILFYIIQYSISIVETCYKLDIPLPDKLVNTLKIYSESEDYKKWEK